MNKISRPTFDDAGALERLAKNRLVKSYPDLQGFVECIQEGYTQYEAAGGNVLAIAAVGVPPRVQNYLKSHYKSPPKDLEYITQLREASEHHACPMCGSLHRGTLDHLLPQEDYAAFAVYSLNLVPACKCNSKRQSLVQGQNPGERILHPYFDECLAERLIEGQFEDLGPIARVKLRICVDSMHPEYAAINFHLRSIVEKTAIIGYLRGRWIEFCRKPSLVVRDLKRNPETSAELREILEAELELLDEIHQGKNNWNSIFVAGLLHRNVLGWIFQQLNRPDRLPNEALV